LLEPGPASTRPTGIIVPALRRLLLLPAFLVVPLAAQGPASTGRAIAVLRDVPVFIPMDSAGTPVVATPPGGGRPVVGLFFRRGSAVGFLANLRRANPQIARRVVIRSASLGSTLRLFETGPGIEYSFVADPEEVVAAARVLTSQGKPGEIPGVPVFLARTPDGGYLTLTERGRTVVPGFLGLRDLEAFRQRYRQTAGAGRGETTVEVTTLEVLIHLLNTSTDPLLTEMDIVPGSRAVEEARS
jgi:hypothetical protein